MLELFILTKHLGVYSSIISKHMYDQTMYVLKMQIINCISQERLTQNAKNKWEDFAQLSKQQLFYTVILVKANESTQLAIGKQYERKMHKHICLQDTDP